MTRYRVDRSQPHPSIPHLYRKIARTPASDLYPNLPSQGMNEVRAATKPTSLAKGLLPDATRQHVSPLGGVAKSGSK